MRIVTPSLALVALTLSCARTAQPNAGEKEVSRTAHLYNLDNGQVIEVLFRTSGTGHGPAWCKLPDGRTIQGEFSTLSGRSVSVSMDSANANIGSTYGWATSQGFSFNQPGCQYGAATAAGDGFVIEVVYAIDSRTGHGFGVGRDNNGGRYRLMF